MRSFVDIHYLHVASHGVDYRLRGLDDNLLLNISNIETLNSQTGEPQIAITATSDYQTVWMGVILNKQYFCG